jgi:hypothetical protein
VALARTGCARYAYASIRTFADANDPADIKAANDLQDKSAPLNR